MTENIDFEQQQPGRDQPDQARSGSKGVPMPERMMLRDPVAESIPSHLRILILTVPHGAGHQRMANALRCALFDLQPGLHVRVVKATDCCARWFRLYYNSYQIPLKYWPAVWEWIEGIQHRSESTTPAWLWRRGAQPLFRLIRDFDPNIVIATEVGMCELAAMLKRESHARFTLVAAVGLDVDRAWVQSEVDLYVSAPGEVAAQLVTAGAHRTKILSCGLPINPGFESLPDRITIRSRLQLDLNTPLLLILFGGAGYGKPSRILPGIRALTCPVQITCITGMNHRLEEKLRRECKGDPRFRVLGWVNNVHEWMAAADLLLSKPGDVTVAEAAATGLPILAFDPLPGGEVRTCELIEKWKIGCWVRHPEHLGPVVSRLLTNQTELQYLHGQTCKWASPKAAHAAAEAVLKLGSRE